VRLLRITFTTTGCCGFGLLVTVGCLIFLRTATLLASLVLVDDAFFALSSGWLVARAFWLEFLVHSWWWRPPVQSPTHPTFPGDPAREPLFYYRVVGDSYPSGGPHGPVPPGAAIGLLQLFPVVVLTYCIW